MHDPADVFARHAILVFNYPMTSETMDAFAPTFRRPSIRDAAVLLVMATAAPLLVHLLPSWDAAPLGAHLLPMFWVTFVAAYFYGAGVGVLTGLGTPLINHLLTAHPVWGMVGILGSELAVFALVSVWIVRRAPRALFAAPLAAVIAMVLCAILQAVLPAFGPTSAVRFFTNALAAGLPGLVLLGGINWFLVKIRPKR